MEGCFIKFSKVHIWLFNLRSFFCCLCMGRFFYQGGKCGMCGDPYDAAIKNHETGGKYATGVITKTYLNGQIININIYVRNQIK